ncbi:2-C-methyl-D-erythritol 4-phosphate cytidylyltransferase/2-C-methyl-D-erythritol 4-phosphate cytidylyltransferase [Mariprofundus ferrinatatus]|uniref:2-C-methyl-D-erythritol 4-phosphate cytidylyltransferase n=1 Tax=Mariprofundus ferrinatatus TaxID=1921087 RepID=A0A2K8L5B7_9PROT|nr:2-C-methyl-D-erythritol 4-phosphate cytidylyltransferase [Mariprofundus ferrinatatus]ATX82508.1 2-C-methyl-D-erythritol 4-phosphate cytidylyltransferase/2-C-methyl-D-erythritol 4-phosphate cytidylyltransferase [Mariprofundus ferrinatatus]
MKVGLLLLAAGSGSRFGGPVPKQYVEVQGKPLFLYTLEHLAADSRIKVVQPVISEGDIRFEQMIKGQHYPFDLRKPVSGGAERSISMQRGLNAMPDDVELVAVHDAARPLPSPELLADVLDVAERFGAAVPGLPLTDTVKRVDAEGKVIETPDRNFLRAVQTPQVARKAWFEKALELEEGRLHLHTDDASLLEAAGFEVHVSRGDIKNRKITTQEDLGWLESQLLARGL